jgi:hypothetical protein
VFLFTPRQRCEGTRTNPFALGYLAVLLIAALGCGVLLLVRVVVRPVAPSCLGAHSLLTLNVLVALVVFLVFGVMSPAFELAFPLAPDVACAGHGPRSAK